MAAAKSEEVGRSARKLIQCQEVVPKLFPGLFHVYAHHPYYTQWPALFPSNCSHHPHRCSAAACSGLGFMPVVWWSARKGIQLPTASTLAAAAAALTQMHPLLLLGVGEFTGVMPISVNMCYRRTGERR